MALRRFDADEFNPFGFHSRLSNILRDFESELGMTRQGPTAVSQGFFPSLDVHDGDKEVTVRADLPGLKKDQIKIDLHDNRLVISGENKEDKSYDDKGWKVRERSFGKFERSVVLPKQIDQNHVSASYNDGVLEVKVGKLAEASQKKSITIK